MSLSTAVMALLAVSVSGESHTLNGLSDAGRFVPIRPHAVNNHGVNNHDGDNDQNDRHRRRLFTGTAIHGGSGLALSEKTALLNDHNSYRSSVALGETEGQPAAANMNSMFWDDSLAALAQSYAEQCVWGHNENNYEDYREIYDAGDVSGSFEFDAVYGRIGENLYAWPAQGDEGVLDSVIAKSTEVWCVGHSLT